MSDEASFVLHYFQLRARAEPLRMIMRHAGIKYRDQLYSVEDWKTAKETMPPGKGVPGIPTRPPGNRALPILELPSGERLVETADIAKYIARSAGPILMPGDLAKADEAQEMWESTMSFPFYWIQPMMSTYPQETSEAIIRGEKPENTMHGNIGELPFSYSEILPCFKAWQHRLAGDFYGGDAPHYGDFAMYHHFDTFRGLEPEIAADLKELHAWAARMEALPSLAKYLAERPKPGHGAEIVGGVGSAEVVGRVGSIYCKWLDPAARGDRRESTNAKAPKLAKDNSPRLCIDHLVWVVRSLSEGMDTLEKLTGVRPCVGGQHLGLGTHNALLSLGDGVYLEILAADPSQPSGAKWLGIDAEQLPRLTTFCARRVDGSGDIEEIIGNARVVAKYDAGPVKECARQTPDGRELRWRLAASNHGHGFSQLPGGGLIPFLIDWTPSSMPHPSQASPIGCELLALRAWHPDCRNVSDMIDALGASECITGGIGHGPMARLEASLATPNGTVTLS